MKEYKNLTASNPKKAEQLMNQMAKEGWEVVSTCQWRGFATLQVLITFSREAK